MRILFVINSPIVGGAEKHTFDLASALNVKGFHCSIFAMKACPHGGLASPYLDEPGPRAGFVARVRTLAKHVAAAAPNLTVAVNERPAVAAMMARALSRTGRAPVAMIWHSTAVRNRKEWLLLLAHRPIFNRLGGITYVSAVQQTFWRRQGFVPRRSTTILNGIDLVRFAPEFTAKWRQRTRERIGFPDSALVLGLNAIMRPEKNHLQLIDAIARLRGQNLDVRGLLVGDGPLRSAIEARASSLGIANHVVVTGVQPDVRPYVAAFDIGVLCSTSIETMSLSVLETMAMGIPVVISELGGATEIVDGANGKIFPVGDLSGLCAGITSLLDGSARDHAGRKARATTLARFDHRVMVENYIDWFTSLAQVRGPRWSV